MTSDLTHLECRVKPIRESNFQLLHDFEVYLSGTISETVSISRDVINRATEIRAQYRFKTPDSIHLAAAQIARCDTFLTNDHRLDRFTEMKVEVIQP